MHRPKLPKPPLHPPAGPPNDVGRRSVPRGVPPGRPARPRPAGPRPVPRPAPPSGPAAAFPRDEIRAGSPLGEPALTTRQAGIAGLPRSPQGRNSGLPDAYATSIDVDDLRGGEAGGIGGEEQSG